MMYSGPLSLNTSLKGCSEIRMCCIPPEKKDAFSSKYYTVEGKSDANDFLEKYSSFIQGQKGVQGKAFIDIHTLNIHSIYIKTHA